MTSLPATAPLTTMNRRRGRLLTLGFLTFVALLLFFWMSRGKSPADHEQDAQAAIDRGDFTAAVSSLEQGLQEDPKRRSSWKLLAEAASRDRRFRRACEAVQELVRLTPGNASQAALQLGRGWMTRNELRPAICALKIATDKDPQSPEGFRLLAQIYGVTGQRREVVACLVELVKRKAFTRMDLVVLCSINPTVNDPARLQAMLAANPADPSPRLPQAMQALDHNEIAAAKNDLIEITTADPENFEAQSILGELYADFFPDQFLKWHAELPAPAAEEARIWLAQAKWLLAHGNGTAAIRCLLECVSREPENLPATALLGQSLKSQGDESLATELTERARRLQRIIDLVERVNDPRAADAQLALIDELVAVGRLWEAWGWCVVTQQSHPQLLPLIRERGERIDKRLRMDLPRTDPADLPSLETARQRYALPDWSQPRAFPRMASEVPPADDSDIRFVDRAGEAGLDFRYVNSAVPEQGRKIFDTMGAGIAVLDFDRDGWPDLYLPQGNEAPARDEGPSDALYRNQSGERYLPVTESAGIHETGYSQGVAAGDYDNDGFPDVYVANLRRNRLFHNNGDGTYTDVTDAAGIQQSYWTVSCAIADLNADGLPELFDVNYVQGNDLLTATCFDAQRRPVVCRPTVFEAAPDTVSLNLGNGRFEPRQAEAGLDLPEGRGLGLVIADFDNDRQTDVFIANDMSANFLLINETDGSQLPLRFRDEAYARGVAVDANGLAQACMGIASADINRDGVLDLLVTNFARESNTLYLSHPGGLFQDLTQKAGLREPSFDPLGFGTQFLDADRDGQFDLVVANGHIDEFLNEPFRMKAQMFRGRANSQFIELYGRQAGPLFDELRLARGLARLDWNRDGKVDFAATDLERPVLLAENATASDSHSLRLKLAGVDSSRDAIGAKVFVVITDGDERYAQLTAGDGYASSNERVVEFGTGPITAVATVRIVWPSGVESHFKSVSCGREWLAIEGRPSLVPLAQ